MRRKFASPLACTCVGLFPHIHRNTRSFYCAIRTNRMVRLGAHQMEITAKKLMRTASRFLQLINISSDVWSACARYYLLWRVRFLLLMCCSTCALFILHTCANIKYINPPTKWDVKCGHRTLLTTCSRAQVSIGIFTPFWWPTKINMIFRAHLLIMNHSKWTSHINTFIVAFLRSNFQALFFICARTKQCVVK